jgi:hypothetical protein
MEYRIPADKEVVIFFSFSGSKRPSRKCSLIEIKGERIYVAPSRKSSQKDFLSVCVKEILRDLKFFKFLENRNENFQLNIFIKAFQRKPFVFKIPKSGESSNDIFEKIIDYLEDIITKNIS